MARRKSDSEARIERITWFLLVLIFAILSFIPESAENTLPRWFVPFSGAIVLLGSGLYQYSRHWRVSPVTWIAGTIMLIFGIMNIYVLPDWNFLGPSLIVFALVILIGVVTGET